MGDILVGTASWTDQSLIKSGRFYPRGCSSAEARLRHYADTFPIVEVDSSYYALPSGRNAQLWVDRTPDDFTFNVKAFRTLTGHQTPRRALPPDILRALNMSPEGPPVYANTLPPEIVDELWRRYLEALEPLRLAGKLGALHFQFPPWFTARRENYEYLIQVRERLPEHLVAVEFRHASWMTEERREATLEFDRAHRFVNVIVDEPQGTSNSIPSVWAVTNPELAIFRLHGRNEATWNLKESSAASDRFNYDYSVGELESFAPMIRRLFDVALKIHIIFNNNFEDQGQRNADTMIGLVGGVRRQRRHGI
jgi:uncharacterized protein YecE (DUF72 family)